MKLIDWERKGNSIRLYFGDDSLINWGGDDWDDCPWETNAGKVYDRYIKAKYDLNMKFDDIVCDSSDSNWSLDYCKFDFRDKAPALVILKAQDVDANEEYDYCSLCQNRKAIRLYLGEDFEYIKSHLPIE